MRVAVVRKIVAPKRPGDGPVARLDRAEEVAQKFEATLSSLGVEWTTRADLAACRGDLACLQKLRAETGATHLLDLEAIFLPDRRAGRHSYTVTVSLVETASGMEVSNKSDRCPRTTCSVPQMTKAIVDLVTAAVADGRKAAMAAPPEPPSPAPSVAEPSQPPAPDSPVVVAPPRDPGAHDSQHARRGRGFGWWAIGGGAALAVAGGVVLGQNGKLTNCKDPMNDLSCPTSRNTKAPGATLVAVGGAALITGVLDLVGAFGSGSNSKKTMVLVGPSSIAIAGRF